MDTNEERKRFEEWGKKRHAHLERKVDDRYSSPYTQLAWLAWQYRSNLGLGTTAWQARASQEPCCLKCGASLVCTSCERYPQAMTPEPRPASGELRERAKIFAAEILAGKNTCPICWWPLAESRDKGCVIGDCSYRNDDYANRDLRKTRNDQFNKLTEQLAAFAASERGGQVTCPTCSSMVPETRLICRDPWHSAESGKEGDTMVISDSKWKPGQPCDHPGCAAHLSHPCEGCGRYGAGLADPPALTTAPARGAEALRDPTPEELEAPLFNAIWAAIKKWDISRTANGMYAGANGTDVCTIIDAIAHVTAAKDIVITPPNRYAVAVPETTESGKEKP